jgi:hypothetical protein
MRRVHYLRVVSGRFVRLLQRFCGLESSAANNARPGLKVFLFVLSLAVIPEQL